MNAITNTVRSAALQTIEKQDCKLPFETLQHAKTLLPTQPIYYERLSPTTLQAMVAFSNDCMLFHIIGEDRQQLVQYKSTRSFPNLTELQVALEQASSTIEEADRLYFMKTNRIIMTNKEQEEQDNSDAPNDYWGDWSSDEEDDTKEEQSQDTIDQESSDSDDDYYQRWSQEPGTLTPGPEGGRILHSFEEDHVIQDKETAALSELTHLLSTTIPNPTKRPLSHTIHPLPKVVLRSMLIEPSEEHALFLNNMRNLVITAKGLGYKGKDILEIVDRLINE